LSPWKSTQRRREPSFFLTKRIGTPCEEFEGQTKPLRRFVQELSEGCHLRFGKRIHPSYWRLGALVEVYFEVVGSVRREHTGLGFAEDIPKFVIFFRDTGNIYRIGVSSKTSSGIGIRDRDRENSVALNTSQARISSGVNKRNGR